MPRWIVACPGRGHRFSHTQIEDSIIDEARRDPLRALRKPTIPRTAKTGLARTAKRSLSTVQSIFSTAKTGSRLRHHHNLLVRKTLWMGTSKGSVTFFSTLIWTTFHRSPLRSIMEPCSGTDLSPSMSRSISSVVGSPLYRNTICLPALMLHSPVSETPVSSCSSPLRDHNPDSNNRCQGNQSQNPVANFAATVVRSCHSGSIHGMPLHLR